MPDFDALSPSRQAYDADFGQLQQQIASLARRVTQLEEELASVQQSATRTVSSARVISGGSLQISMPSEFSVEVTPSGLLRVSKAAQSANSFWAGPSTGTDAEPTFRALVTADVPDGIVTLAKLSITGTPDGTKFLRDDFTWQALPP